jgi:hypothetical protein
MRDECLHNEAISTPVSSPLAVDRLCIATGTDRIDDYIRGPLLGRLIHLGGLASIKVALVRAAR